MIDVKGFFLFVCYADGSGISVKIDPNDLIYNAIDDLLKYTFICMEINILPPSVRSLVVDICFALVTVWLQI